jgi:hypothetical protein
MLGIFYFTRNNQQLYCLSIFQVFVLFQVILRINACLKINSFELDFQVIFFSFRFVTCSIIKCPQHLPIYY